MVSAQEKRVLKAHRGSIKKGFVNFITPNLISATAKKNVVFELTSGKAIFKRDKGKLFGATVLKRTPTTKSGFKSLGGNVFGSKAKAKSFLTKAKLKFK